MSELRLWITRLNRVVCALGTDADASAITTNSISNSDSEFQRASDIIPLYRALLLMDVGPV
ncbi:pectin lyase D [Aspergillus luchuensis]|uniref:Pectin lyase D n=1 Tax=Aspergillus kawachii TaxID=1069201 RepID=A0A146F1Q7_ASPKA|nr:pectin lyase D [Aspergillus luchuensis]